MKASVLRWMTVVLAAAAAAPAYAQLDAADEDSITKQVGSIQDFVESLWIPRSRFTDSPHVREAFRSVVSDVIEATVEVRHRGKRVAYGGIVGPDGWIVTKASQIELPIVCRMRSGREYDARLVGVDEETDLAMLKIDAKDLPTLKLLERPAGEETQVVSIRAEASEEQDTAAPTATEEHATEHKVAELMPGDWLATAGLSRDPVAIGVVSVRPREIEKRPGFLGVSIDLEYTPTGDAPAGVRLQGVSDDSAAEAAGLEAGDVILVVNDQPTHSPQDLKDVIGDRHPGDRVELEIARGGERLQFLAVLRGWAPNPAERRAAYQNTLGGELSERRFGFPSALQHDTVLRPNQCGGPMVDLDGRVVAFNIARAGRTESYALPVEEVRERLFDLMSGRLAPAALDD